MNLPNDLLDIIIEHAKMHFKSFRRGDTVFQHKKEDILELTSELYDHTKNIKWLENSTEIKNLFLTIEKPWAYHYSVNFHWVFFFKLYYESVAFRRVYGLISEKKREEFEIEYRETYNKVRLLYEIFNFVDGIVEDGDTVYLIKDDISFIKPNLTKWTI